MKHLYVLFIIGFALLSAGCSQTAEFAVVNESAAPVKVVYKIRALPPADGYSPKVIDVADLASRRWQALGSREYLIDLRAHTIAFDLPAQKALRIISIQNYAASDETAQFPIQEVTLTNPDGETVLSDEAARQAFVNENDGNYFLRYKQPTSK